MKQEAHADDLVGPVGPKPSTDRHVEGLGGWERYVPTGGALEHCNVPSAAGGHRREDGYGGGA